MKYPQTSKIVSELATLIANKTNEANGLGKELRLTSYDELKDHFPQEKVLSKIQCLNSNYTTSDNIESLAERDSRQKKRRTVLTVFFSAILISFQLYK